MSCYNYLVRRAMQVFWRWSTVERNVKIQNYFKSFYLGIILISHLFKSQNVNNLSCTSTYIVDVWSAYWKIFSKSYWIKLKLDCIYHFSIDLETNETPVLFQINGEMVYTIWFHFDLIRFWKDFSVGVAWLHTSAMDSPMVPVPQHTSSRMVALCTPATDTILEYSFSAQAVFTWCVVVK